MVMVLMMFSVDHPWSHLSNSITSILFLLFVFSFVQIFHIATILLKLFIYFCKEK